MCQKAGNSERLTVEDQTIQEKMAVIRQYLLDSISQCTIQDAPTTDAERILLVSFGGTGNRTVRVSSALLSNKNQNTLQLEWGLKDNNIAMKVLNGPEVYLTPSSVVPKD